MMNISPNKLQEMYKKGYSLEIIYILDFIQKGENVDELVKNIPKFGGVVQTCIRKNLITNNYNLCMEGKELLSFLSSKEEAKLIKKKPKDDNISLFWAVFPSTDTFEHKGKKFVGSRALKTNKSECKNKLEAILNTGDYKIEDIIEAVKLDVFQKKEMSYKTGTNKLSYLQNSLTYLRQLSFEPYLELIKAGHKIEEKSITTSNETYI